MTKEELKTLKEKIKELEGKLALYDKLCHYLLEAVIVSDFKGRVLFANQTAGRMFGIKNIQSYLGKTVFPFIMPESRKDVLRDYLNVLRGKEEYFAYYRVRDARGRKFWVESIGRKIDFQGKKAVLTTLRDATWKKELEDRLKASEAKLRIILENLLLHVAVIDQKGKFILWNKISEKIFGYKSNEVIGKLTSQDLHCSSQEALEVIKVATRKGRFEGDCWMRKKDKTKFLMHLYVVPWYDEQGKIIGFLGNGIDITEHRQLENQLKDKVKELEKLNRLMIGRELKMVELKKKIKSLENQLKKK